MGNINDLVGSYIQSISSNFAYEQTSEMGYRTAFETLIRGIFESINVKRIGHDDKAQQGNKPDFVVMKNDIPILYIEAKDIGVSLDKIEKSEQMTRYYGYTNLVLTDYVEFRFYRNGEKYGDPIIIGTYDKQKREIQPHVDSFETLGRTLLDFAQSHKEPIRSGSHLAKIMGGKAQRIRDNVYHHLEESPKKDPDLVRLYEAIKSMLVHDLTFHTFSDLYAQTMVYGLFVARYYDKSPGNFSRIEARELIPNSNRFLKHFFDHIVGVDFKTSLRFIVDELCEVYSHADVTKLMEDYYKTSKDKQNNYDPVIHFYEDFLNKYDPELRKRMGAYYTPQPVVNFIVRSVDEILKQEFGLDKGLADTTKLSSGKHKVQILDPATGTGTFISTIIEKIYDDFNKIGQTGRWPAYVHGELLPRIHGFELMMAPYTIAHLRIGINLKRKGFWDFHRRLGIYLTNTLENAQGLQLPMGFGLAESIAEESKEASVIKNETPIMVVVGNPPYSGISSNETQYANSLVERYKVEPGGKLKLQERKHWLNDDYVKFIAFAESMIEKTGDGIVAMITNNGYLDNPTFRGMRWHLAKTFDKVFLLDLHGNAKKKETTPAGGKDENVFDIMQGVGIMLAIKTGKKKSEELGEIYYSDLFGLRGHKFTELEKTPSWKKLTLDPKMVYFVPKNTMGQEEYEKGIRINELFRQNTTGIVTMGDNFIVNEDKGVIIDRIQKLAGGEYSETNLNTQFGLGKNYAKFILDNHTKLEFDEDKLTRLAYRPFDIRWTYFDNKVLWRWRENVMRNYFKGGNLGLLFTRMTKGKDFAHVQVVNNISEVIYLSPLTGTNAFNAPLYIYQDDGTRTPNFDLELLKKLTENLTQKYEPEDIFDYIYAVLHSPKYREKYKEFLKTDFPKVPQPRNTEIFRKLIELGRELRQLHLLESPKVHEFITTFPESGSDIVEKPFYKSEKVFINDKQYFGNVPEIAWNFHIGGYQPAQKWLKDRKGKSLTDEDIEHYQKIIVALTETSKVMKNIDTYLS